MKSSKGLFSKTSVIIKLPDDPIEIIKTLEFFWDEIISSDSNHIELTRRTISKYKDKINNLLSLDLSFLDIVRYPVTFGFFEFHDGESYCTLENKNVGYKLINVKTEFLTFDNLSWFSDDEFLRILERGYFGDTEKDLSVDVMYRIVSMYFRNENN